MWHSNYPPDWQQRRRKVFERDGYECQNCEFQSPPDEHRSRSLHAHHQKRIADGGGHGFNNLITLCEACHCEVHSSRGVDEAPPPEMHECAYDGCDEVRGEWALHNGGYCNAQCEYRDRAATILESLEDEETFCSSCFSNWPPEQETCPECGNWAPDETEAFSDGKIDETNLAVHILWKADQLGLRRD